MFRAVGLGCVLLIGLASRHWRIGWIVWDKSMGDLCYGAGAYLGMGILRRRSARLKLAGVAFLFCLGIEFFKLTGWPREWGSNPVARVVFGTVFSWVNIVCYALGIAAVWGIERLLEN